MANRIQLRDQFLEILRSAMRESRPYDEVAREFGWVLFERKTMTDAVSRYRASVGLPQIDPALILRAENSACGHCDYASKYALYCAELALTGKSEP